LVQFIIGVDLAVLLVIFLSSQFGISFPFPLPGRRLNNPLALLLILFSIRGMLNVPFRERYLGTLSKLLTCTPHRFYFFSFLIAAQCALQVMWFTYPENFHWNLNAEQGYGTHFAAIQLYILGLVVLITTWADCGKEAEWKEKLPWYLVAGVYFYIGLDDCIGIHENFIVWTRRLIPESLHSRMVVVLCPDHFSCDHFSQPLLFKKIPLFMGNPNHNVCGLNFLGFGSSA